MASYIAKVSAFFFSGRFIRTVRTGPSSVTMTRSVIAVRQRRLRVGDAVGAFGDAAFKAGGLHRDVLGEEARQRGARRRRRRYRATPASACSASMQPPAALPNSRR